MAHHIVNLPSYQHIKLTRTHNLGRCKIDGEILTVTFSKHFIFRDFYFTKLTVPGQYWDQRLCILCRFSHLDENEKWDLQFHFRFDYCGNLLYNLVDNMGFGKNHIDYSFHSEYIFFKLPEYRLCHTLNDKPTLTFKVVDEYSEPVEDFELHLVITWIMLIDSLYENKRVI